MNLKLTFGSIVNRSRYIPVFCICLLLIGNRASLFAQGLPEESAQDSVQIHFFPVAAYTSDEGIIVGGALSRIDFRGGTKPFHSRFTTMPLFSTKGYISLNIKYQQTRLFNTPWRLLVNPYLYRIVNDNYFGIGNNTTFSNHLWNKGFYYIETLNLGLDVKATYPLFQSTSNNNVKLQLQGGFGYLEPHSKGDSTKFTLDNPNGLKGKWHNYIGAGLIWDNRNNEDLPTRGNWALVDVNFSPKIILNDYNNLDYKIQYVHYFSFHLIRDVVVAQRVSWHQMLGHAPFWYQPYLGDDQTLRGFPERRFIGKATMIYNLELRTWLFAIPSWHIRVGGQLFMDAGKIYETKDNYHHFFQHYKHTLGFGGSLSLFDPHFFIRGDFGFSKDLWRIYAGFGYMF